MLNKNLVAFTFESNNVRTIDRDGDVWFVAGDIAKILGFNHTPHMIRMLDDDERGVHKVDTLGGKQENSIISESGLYICIFNSNKPQAKAFRKWVTKEVLPTIRKHGVYATQHNLQGYSYA